MQTEKEKNWIDIKDNFKYIKFRRIGYNSVMAWFTWEEVRDRLYGNTNRNKNNSNS